MIARAVIVLGLLLALTRSTTADPSNEVVVIVHPKNKVSSVDKKFLTNAFLKKKTRWGDNKAIKPVDLPAKSAVRKRFSKEMLGRSVEAVRRYWNQVVFSGRGVPPPELDTEAEVVEYVLAHPGAIGYVSGAADLKGAKVVEVR